MKSHSGILTERKSWSDVKKILILANSSAGLYDFRNELIERLLGEYQMVVSLPDEVKTRELAEEGCKVVHTPINRRGVNPAEDFKLLKAYFKLLKAEKPDLVFFFKMRKIKRFLPDIISKGKVQSW